MTGTKPLQVHLLQGGDHPAWNSLLLQMQALLEVQRGNLEAAVGVIVEGTRYARDARGDCEIFLGIHSANVALARGDLQSARGTLGQVRKAWRENFAGDAGLETILDVLTASLEFEAGRLSSARLQIKRSAHRMPHVEAWLDIYVAAYETIARLLVDDLGLASSLASLRAQQDTLIVSGLPRVSRLVKALEICLVGEAALRGEIVVEEIETISANEEISSLSWHERELFALVVGYAGLRNDRPDLTIVAMAELLCFAKPRGINRSVLRATLMLVAALDRNGDVKEADCKFDEALAFGSRTGMSRVFVEIGGEAVRRRCLTRISQLNSKKVADPSLLRLLRTISRWQASTPSQREARFTEREMDVLGALSKGGPDKMIGRRLGITDHAVRYHLKNIYRKLGVGDRIGAVAQAREIGVLA